MAEFILNDETKTNSYGFRVLNKGIDLRRFSANPVMLDQHINSTKTVVGRWLNLKIKDQNLIAESEFDTSDPDSKALAGKVERGFIKGASIGVSFNNKDMVMAKDGVLELTSCELFEASICAVPSNANAITLYTKAGVVINKSTFELSIKQYRNISLKQFKTNNMDLLQSLIKLLGLAPEATEVEVLDAIEKLIQDKNTAIETQAKELVSMALADGRITSPQANFYEEAAKRDYASTSKALQSLNPKISLMSLVNNKQGSTIGKADKTNWTLDDYRKNAPKELASNPTLYKELIAAENKI